MSCEMKIEEVDPSNQALLSWVVISLVAASVSDGIWIASWFCFSEILRHLDVRLDVLYSALVLFGAGHWTETRLPLRPSSYYSFAGGINWKHVAAQLLLQALIFFRILRSCKTCK